MTTNKLIDTHLRDYFAAAALTAIYKTGVAEGVSPEDIALACYMMADAMMEEKEKVHE